MTTKAVGIDLGTTFCAVAHVNRHGVPEVLPNAEGDRLTPSVILFDKDDVIVGNYAKQSAVVYPEQVVEFVKRHMGDDDYTFFYREEAFNPERLSSFILAKLKHDAELRLGHPVEQAVITVPAYFGDKQRRATMMAGEMAGLRVLKLVNEPTSAAFAYGLSNMGKDRNVLVFDLGGGTFDVTLYLRDNRYAKPKPITRTIDAQLPTKTPGGQPLYAKVGQSTDEGDEIWTALLEKRLAMETGSYDQISGGNIGKNVPFKGVSELLTGKSELYIPVDSQSSDELLAIMDGALTEKRPIMVGSRTFDKDPKLKADAEAKNVFGNHAYALESVDIEKKVVNLQNPWGSRHVKELSIDDFKRMYSGVRVGGH